MERYYRRHSLEKALGLSRSTIYRLMQTGDFPRPVKLGHRAVGWFENDIQNWLEARKSHPKKTEL